MQNAVNSYVFKNLTIQQPGVLVDETVWGAPFPVGEYTHNRFYDVVRICASSCGTHKQSVIKMGTYTGLHNVSSSDGYVFNCIAENDYLNVDLTGWTADGTGYVFVHVVSAGYARQGIC